MLAFRNLEHVFRVRKAFSFAPEVDFKLLKLLVFISILSKIQISLYLFVILNNYILPVLKFSSIDIFVLTYKTHLSVILPWASMHRAKFNMVWWNFQENYSSKCDINDWKWIIDFCSSTRTITTICGLKCK